MAKNDQPDFALPVDFMKLGEMLSIAGNLRRPLVRTSERPQASANEVEAIVDALLDKSSKVPAVRRILGLKSGMAREAARIRLKAVAILGYQSLRACVGSAEIGDLAAAVADHKLLPNEGLLKARHEIGIMMAEDTLIGSVDTAGVFNKVCLPARGLEFLAGGKPSMGLLTASKLANILLPKGMDEYERPAKEEPIPSASELRDRISEKVIGLDRQVSSLSSLLVMHLARAKMIRSGKDGGTNLAILLIGGSGSGKTWMMETAGSVVGCPFASVAATSMSSEAYIGGKVDDLFKALVAKAKGDVQAARYGIAFTDEWDSKASGQAFGHTSGGGREVSTLCIQQEFLVSMQGAEFLISGKRSMERPVMFDSRGTFFAFAGAFAGLHEIIRKRNGSQSIGFASPDGTKSKRQQYLLDAIAEYGYLKTWTNRLSSVLFLPNPTAMSLGQAAAHGILDGVNAILGELGIMLFPQPDAIPCMAEYALETKTFYRGIRSIWWAIAESAVSAGTKGTLMVTKTDVDSAISRLAYGSSGQSEVLGMNRSEPKRELEDSNACNEDGFASAD